MTKDFVAYYCIDFTENSIIIKLMVTKGERRGGMNQEIGIDRYDTTL